MEKSFDNGSHVPGQVDVEQRFDNSFMSIFNLNLMNILFNLLVVLVIIDLNLMN